MSFSLLQITFSLVRKYFYLKELSMYKSLKLGRLLSGNEVVTLGKVVQGRKLTYQLVIGVEKVPLSRLLLLD